MTRICNFPISKTKRCTQPIADGRPNCGRHKTNLSADQLGQNPIVYRRGGILHAWAGKPGGIYCLIHNDSTSHVLYQLAGETPPCCLAEIIVWSDDDGQWHRDDGPAILWPDGTQDWYRHGKIHREDGPAVIRADGTRIWWQNGERHRDNGPAVIRADGRQEWWQHHRRHKDDGPAVIAADGTQEWWQHGRLHRDDGPAVIIADGAQEWYQRNERHREDGPAIIEADGTQDWYWHGERVDAKTHAKLRKQSGSV